MTKPAYDHWSVYEMPSFYLYKVLLQTASGKRQILLVIAKSPADAQLVASKMTDLDHATVIRCHQLREEPPLAGGGFKEEDDA
jgi:hypothetical protein